MADIFADLMEDSDDTRLKMLQNVKGLKKLAIIYLTSTIAAQRNERDGPDSDILLAHGCISLLEEPYSSVCLRVLFGKCLGVPLAACDAEEIAAINLNRASQS